MHYKTIFTKKSSIKGPKTVIFGGIHGNEQGGINAVQNISLQPDSGLVRGVLCNLPAINLRQRNCNRNINRLFGRRHKFQKRSTYEFPLVESLEKLLQESDFLLDIHNSTTLQSPHFLITENREVGKYLDVEYVCYGFDTIQPGGSDYFMNTCLGKVGICLECGYLTHTNENWLHEQIQNFLRYAGNTDESPKEFNHQKYCHVTLCYKPQRTFHSAGDFRDFQPVLKGECIGYDGKEKIEAGTDGFVLWVSSHCPRGREAFVFGEFLA